MNFKRTESKENERFVIFEMNDASMSPKVEVGDEVQVDTRAEVIDGDLVVAVVEDGRTVLRKMKLQSDDEYIFIPFNSRYECIFSKRPVIIGRAVRLYRRIGNTPFIKESESNIAGLVPLFDPRAALDNAPERESGHNE